MEYREIGKTGKHSSIIGLGCEHLDGKPFDQVKETIDAALENGINMMDVFMPGNEVRENIARALGSRRDKVMIQGHIGSTDIRQQYDICRDLPVVKKYFENLLRIFGYIDFGMMFFIDSEEDYKGVFETGFADYVQQLKQKGDIKHIGFSSHNPNMAMRVINTGLPEMMMFSINLAFDLYPAETNALDELNQGLDREAFRGFDPTRAALYALCEQKNIGITVMKTLGAGKLISAEHTPFDKPLTVPQCVHYALTRPAVASVMLGCQTRAEVLDAVTYLDTSDEERDYTAVMNTMRNDFAGNCVYCSHCQPCPAGIDIAAVNKYLDIARLDESNVLPSVRSHYSGLAHGGKDCIRCGKCEKRCPFSVPIIKNMADAAKIFG
ncbi:aldo/keto reductase [Clostridium sp. AM58-1XD]|uniref:aldo/keto reductase n=1 Tax=Clostridium sp. AM58-1XD TaxID=2292307 RepID=UPI000E53A5D1|nr:aldo/keto reductase [Clostridium sp. AM58-1XD]RGY99092.1 aldo/keto reductase [Clostridium sp. AM58-1XD]